jgi:trigger factor
VIKDKSVRYLENSEVRVTLTVPKEEVKAAYDDLVADYCKKANIPGFRRGKVPPSVLIRKFGDALLDEAEDNLIRKTFGEAIEDVERKPLPYSTPYLVPEQDGKPSPAAETAHDAPSEPAAPAQPSDAAPEPAHTHTHEKPKVSLDEDYTFTVSYDTYPEIELGEYRGIDVDKPGYEITEEDVARELGVLQEQNALIVDKTDGTVEKGNIVTVTYAEIDEAGAEKQGTRREGFSFEVGTGYNLYALDDDVLGMGSGEQKTLDKHFPDDYQHKELAGRSVKVRVEIGAVREKNLPAIDDDLAQDISDRYKNLEDLRADIRQKLEAAAVAAVRSRMVASMLDTLYQTCKVPLPRAMVNLQLASNWQTLLGQVRGDEKAADRYLRSMGRTRQTMIEQWKPDAERRLRSSLIVATIMDKENIQATDEEVEARIADIAARRGTSVEEVRSRATREDALDDIRSAVRERKFEDFLLSVATIAPGPSLPFLDLIRGNE